METIENKESELKKLEDERTAHATRIFWLCLEIIFIFGIPAAIVLGIVFYTGNKNLAIYLLPIAFVTSWVMVIVKYKKMSKRLMELDTKIRELKKR